MLTPITFVILRGVPPRTESVAGFGFMTLNAFEPVHVADRESPRLVAELNVVVDVTLPPEAPVLQLPVSDSETGTVVIVPGPELTAKGCSTDTVSRSVVDPGSIAVA